MLLVSYLRGVFGVDLVGEVKNRAARLTLWSAFLAGQLVVMGASANIFDKDCGTDSVDAASSYCTRTKFGISVGAIGTFFALGVVGMKMLTAVAPFVVEGVLAVFLCILNGFGVAFITSAQGPGSPIGNLYYFVSGSHLCGACEGVTGYLCAAFLHVFPGFAFSLQSWISWLCSFMLVASVYDDYQNGGTVGNDTENGEEHKSNGDIPMETIDDV